MIFDGAGRIRPTTACFACCCRAAARRIGEVAEPAAIERPQPALDPTCIG